MVVKLFGAVLVWGGCGLMGLWAALKQRRRVLILEEVARALELMEYELLLKHQAIPELLASVCRGCSASAAELFVDCKTEIEKGNSFTDAWEKSVEKHILVQEDKGLLKGLCGILGQYDPQEQGRGLRRLWKEVERRAMRQREESKTAGKVYGALGLATGGFLTLSLL